MDNKEYVHSLRLLANFYEHHPDTPKVRLDFTIYVDGGRAKALELIKDIGNVDKEYTLYYFHIKKRLGNAILSFAFDRGAVCERKVIGKKQVEEVNIPAHEEDIVEWDCHPLLKV